MPCDKSSKRRGLMRLSMASVALPSALLLQACAGQTPAPQVRVPQSFREACVGPVSPMRTQADGDTFMVQQEAALKVCDAKRAALVEIIDGANVAVRPRKRWPF